MDLKSSTFVFCKRRAAAVRCAESGSGVSPSRTPFSSGVFSKFLFRVGLFSGLVLLPLTGFCQAKSPTKLDLSVSTVQGAARTQATFTAKVASADSSAANPVPTGSVSFMDGDRSIGAAFVDAEGRATYTATALPAGVQKITAVYVGDESHQRSASEPAAVTSEASGVPAFTLSATATSLSVVAGQSVTTVITATPENGFNQAVSLSCSGISYAASTCVFTPAQVTPGAVTSSAPNGTPVASTLTIQTTALNGALRPIPRSGGAETAYAIALPGILALAGLGLARKRGLYAARIVGTLLLCVAGGLGANGCAARYNYYHRPPADNPGTPAGTYTVVVSGITGTGSSLSTATVQITLTVTAS